MLRNFVRCRSVWIAPKPPSLCHNQAPKSAVPILPIIIFTVFSHPIQFILLVLFQLFHRVFRFGPVFRNAPVGLFWDSNAIENAPEWNKNLTIEDEAVVTSLIRLCLCSVWGL